jgi:hypothetical protein
VSYNFDGTAYTVTLSAGQTGVGGNAASLGNTGPLLETFDSLASSGTANTNLPAGAVFSESGTTADSTYAAADGSGTGVGGNTFSYGTTGAGERAFGGLRSGSNTPTLGYNVKNDTGADLHSVSLSYVGEQWRQGDAGHTDKLDFQFSVDATGLTDGTWFDVDLLDFIAPVNNAATGTALDGNAAANQVRINGTITVDVAAGSGIWFRWVDFDATGTDDGLAIDNLTVVPEPASLSLLAVGGLGLLRRRRRRV